MQIGWPSFRPTGRKPRSRQNHGATPVDLFPRPLPLRLASHPVARREGWGASWAPCGNWTFRAASGAHQLDRAAVTPGSLVGPSDTHRHPGNQENGKAGVRMAPAHAAVNGSESGAGPVPHPQLFRLAPPALLPLDLLSCRRLYRRPVRGYLRPNSRSISESFSST